jgi:hypothetical protein
MKKLYFLAISLFMSVFLHAQTTIDLTSISTTYTTTYDGSLVLDDAKCASKLASPNVYITNPFKGQSFTEAQISFDMYTYQDSLKVLGALFGIYGGNRGRLYFSNGSYLGYNGTGGYFDSNLKSYALGTDFIGTKTWKNIKLQFSSTGYALYVDNTLAFNQSSTSVTISNTVTDYSNVVTFLQKADTLVFGTGSFWSDNSHGIYYDLQYSYLKNITFTPNFSTTGVADKEEDGISVFPNPATSSVKVNGLTEVSEISVLDINGKAVINKSADGDANIDLSSIAKGTYLIKIKSKTNTIVRKIIVE